MGAGASTEGVQGLPSDPSEWTARHVELCLASLKLEAFVPAARAAELNGSVLEKMEAHPDGFAAALSGIDFDDAAAQKVAGALVHFRSHQPEAETAHSAKGMQSAVEIIPEGADSFPAPEFDDDDWTVLQILFAHDKKVSVRPRDMAEPEMGCTTTWWLLQCDVFAHAGHHTESCLVHLGSEIAIKREARQIRSLGASLGTHCPTLNSVAWVNGRGGARLSLQGSLWAAPQLRATPHTPLLQTFAGLYKNRVWALLSGRIGAAPVQNIIDDDDPEDEGSQNPSVQARAAKLAFGGSCGVSAALTAIIDDAMAPSLLTGRRRVPLNLFRHYNLECSLTEAIMKLEQIRDGKVGSGYEIVEKMVRQHPSSLFDPVRTAGSIIGFFRDFLTALLSSPQYHADELRPEPQETDDHANHTDDASDDEEGGSDDVGATDDEMHARCRWISPMVGTLDPQHVLLELHNNHPIFRGNDDPGALCNAKITSDGSGQACASSDWGRGVRHAWLTRIAPESGDSIELERHVLEPMAQLEVDLCCWCTPLSPDDELEIGQALDIVDAMMRLPSLSEPIVSALTRARQLDDAGQHMKAKFQLLWLSIRQVRHGVLSLVGNDQDPSQYSIALLSRALKRMSQLSGTTSLEGNVVWAIICAVSAAVAVFKGLQTGVRATEVAPCDAEQYRAPLQRHAYMHEIVKHLHLVEAVHMQFEDPFLQTLVGSSSLPTYLVRSPLSIAKAASASKDLSGDEVDFKVAKTAAKIDDEEDALSRSLVIKGLGPLEPALQQMFPGIPLTFGQTFAIVSNQGTGRTMALRRMARVAATKMLQWHVEKTSLIDQAIQAVHTLRKKRNNADRKGSAHGNQGIAKTVDGQWSMEQLYDVIEDSATFGSDMLVPLFIPLPEVATLAFYENADMLTDDLIALWVRARYGSFAAEADNDDYVGARNNVLSKRGRMLLAALSSRKVLLFLDGLDEVPVLHSEMCEYIMSRLPGQKHPLVVFSTCLQTHMASTVEYSLLDSCEQFNLLPLDTTVKLAVVNARAQMMAQQGIPSGNMSLTFAASTVLSRARDLISRKLNRECSPFQLAAVVGASLRFTFAQLSADPLLSPLKLSAAETVLIAVQLQLVCAIAERQLASSQRVQAVLSRSIHFVSEMEEEITEMQAIQGENALRLLQQVAYEMHKRRTRVASITHVETAATEHEISSGVLEVLCKHVQLNKVQMLQPMSTEIATEVARGATKAGRSRGHIVQPVMYQLGSHLCMQQYLAAHHIVRRLVDVAQKGADETGLPVNSQESVEAGETTDAIKVANVKLEEEIRSVFSDDHSWETANDHGGAPEALSLLRDPWWQPVVLISASLLPEWLWVEVMRVAVAHDRSLLTGLYSFAIFNADLKAVQSLKECDVVVPEHILTPDDETGMLPLHSACADVQPSAALVEVLIEVYPQACAIADKARKSLPIHYACDARFPSERMIRALLEREPDTTKVRDAFGCLPFHYICKACSDPSFKQLVQAVLECNGDAAREADDEGRTALHFASMASKPSGTLISVLLDLVPDSSCAVDQVHDRMPIHYMCDSQRSAVTPDIVRAMLKTAPKSAVHPDKDGHIPLDILLRQDEISVDVLCAMIDFLTGTKSTEDEADEECSEEADALLDKNEILMRAMKFLFTHPRPTVEVVEPMLFAVQEIQKDADKILKSISADIVVGAETADASKTVVVPIEAAVELFLVMPEGSIAVRDNWGQHPLHWTCANEIKIGIRGARLDTMEGQLQSLADTVHALLKIDSAGAQIVDKQGRLPLHYACLNPYPCASAIEALMEAFPEASSSKDVKGMTPLHYLCSSKRATAAMVKSLVAFDEETAEEEAEREMLPLHFACKVASESSDWAQAVQALIEANPHGPRAAEAGGSLPLHLACSTQPLNESVILVLLQSYAEAAEETADGAGGKLPLHLLCASRRPSERLVRAMLEAYPDAAQESDMMAGRLPVHYACENRSCSSVIVRVLIDEYPSSVEEADELAGRLPVHWLCRQPDLDIELLEDVYGRYTESLEVMDETGMLPLHIACGLRRPSEAVVRFLLDKFPEGVTTRDSQTNLLPLEIACDSSLLPKSIIRACLEIEEAPEEHFELAKQAVKESEKTTMNAYFEVAAVVRSVQWERSKFALTDG